MLSRTRGTFETSNKEIDIVSSVMALLFYAKVAGTGVRAAPLVVRRRDICLGLLLT